MTKLQALELNFSPILNFEAFKCKSSKNLWFQGLEKLKNSEMGVLAYGTVRRVWKLVLRAAQKEDIWSVPQCTMLLCYSGSTSHNVQCFYDDHDQFSQFSPHCRIHVHSSIILKDTVWIAEFSWFSSLFGIFKAQLSLDNLNR